MGDTKREKYISWDEYFMGIALISSLRSKDPNTQVGSCIVNSDNKIIGIGYNGLPKGCSDDDFPWGNSGDFLQTKYPYTCHAELNAILNSIGTSLENYKIYTTLFPCNECTKALIQVGIKDIIYLSDKYSDTDIVKASKRMLNTANVTFTKFEANRKDLLISFENMEDTK